MKSKHVFSRSLIVAVVFSGSVWGQSGKQANDSVRTEKELTNSIGMKFALIPAGEFLMGGAPAEKWLPGFTVPQHKVKITQPYYMGIYEVTHGQFKKLYPKRRHLAYPRANVKDDPDWAEEGVAWTEAVRFCRLLSDLPEEKKAGRVYRLPTEAEWEYACRAGTTTRFHYGDSLSIEQANFNHQEPYPRDAKKGPYLDRPVKVGSYKPNAFGLYDMHGNVWEWVSDWDSAKFEFGDVTVDPQGPVEPMGRDQIQGKKIWRGGGWRTSAENCSSARRATDGLGWNDMPDVGFRVVLSIPQPRKEPVEKPIAKEEPLKLDKPVTNSIGMKLQPIPSGKFMMGSPHDEMPRVENTDFEDLHEVEITRSFHIGTYEVTQEEFEKVIGKNPSYFGPKGQWTTERKDLKVLKPDELKRHPVENVSWEQAAEFCRKLSEMPEERKAGRVYRLPTEAEWEYVCRARTTSPFSFGQTLSRGTQANCKGPDVIRTAFDPEVNDKPALGRTTTVGSYPANPFGLHDMHGNVSEWCQDEYAFWFYFTSRKQDPVFVGMGFGKVRRGGSWEDYSKNCRSARRAYYVSHIIGTRDIGFRVVMTLAPSGPPK